MANIASARKRARQAAKLNKHNSSLRSRLRTAIKSVRKAVATGDKAAAANQFRASMSIIDSIGALFVRAIEPGARKHEESFEGTCLNCGTARRAALPCCCSVGAIG